MTEDILRSRIRALRTQRGWSQEQLAEVSDLSLTTIKKAESPTRGGELSAATLHALANAFGIATTDLYTDRAPEPGLTLADNDQVLARLRAAISPPVGITGLALEPEPGEEGPVDLAQIHHQVLQAHARYTDDQYDAVGEMLPGIIQRAHRAVAESEGSDEAYRTRARALRMAGTYLTQTRQIDLALTALRSAIRDAVQAGDIPFAASAISGQGWALTRQGRLDECERLCVATADEIEPRSIRKAAPAELAAWGHLLFRAAAAAVRNSGHDRAEELLSVAGSAASALRRETECWPATFGPLTVAVKGAEFALLEGRPDRTLAAAQRLPRPEDVGNITALNWERHRLDVAQALVMTGELDRGAAVLTGIRERTPQWLRRQRSAYETVQQIIGGARRPSDEMVVLATHLGVTP